MQWENQFLLNGQICVSDRRLLIAQRYACVAPLPPPATPVQHERIRAFFRPRVSIRFGLDALTHHKQDYWSGPGPIYLSGGHGVFLRDLPCASALQLGLSAGPYDPVQIFEGMQRIGMLMRIVKIPPYGPELLALAESGHAFFIMYLARLHMAGARGAPKDYKQALHWLSRAAELDVPEAACMIGGAFFNGVGTAPDPVKSLLMLEKAISLGCRPAIALRLQVIQALGPEQYRSATVQISRELGLQPQPSGPGTGPRM